MKWETSHGIRHHTQEACDGGPCPFHNPSDHPMVDWPMTLRETGLIERRCEEHGVGHPDPDSIRFMDKIPGYEESEGTWGVHGCCGCCRS